MPNSSSPVTRNFTTPKGSDSNGKGALKIIKAPAGYGSRSMSEKEVEEFLDGGKLLIRLATINPMGDPEIQPAWYVYDRERLYLFTETNSRKVQNIRRRNSVYFTVDTEMSPYRGVKGKATAMIVDDNARALAMTEKIVRKYVGDPDGPDGKEMMDAVKKGTLVVVEIIPKFYSVWDYAQSR